MIYVSTVNENIKKKYTKDGEILIGRGRRGQNGPRTRRNKGKRSEDQKTNPSRDRGGTEHLLHHSGQQRRILLQHLRHDRHQYHFSLSF
ncbi:hypothetical protein JHK84_037438 [Glycine max]|nr:hypothetical protein JHK84_037438 [Glycine max]